DDLVTGVQTCALPISVQNPKAQPDTPAPAESSASPSVQQEVAALTPEAAPTRNAARNERGNGRASDRHPLDVSGDDGAYRLAVVDRKSTRLNSSHQIS